MALMFLSCPFFSCGEPYLAAVDMEKSIRFKVADARSVQNMEKQAEVLERLRSRGMMGIPSLGIQSPSENGNGN